MTIKWEQLAGNQQVRIETAADLTVITELDSAHWMATSASCSSFTCDPLFANYLDDDNNGRVRCDEVRRGYAWLQQILADTSGIDAGSDTLLLSALNTDHKDGQHIKACCEQILDNLKAENRKSISLAQVRNRTAILSAAERNGDGVITAASIADPSAQTLLLTIMDTCGHCTDASGEKGINQALLQQFIDSAEKWLKWHTCGSNAIEHITRVWGEGAEKAYHTLQNIEKKLDEYFNLCDAAFVDPTLETKLNAAFLNEKALPHPAPEQVHNWTKNAPIAPVQANAALSLDQSINPQWRDAFTTFYTNVFLTYFKHKDPLHSDIQLNRHTFTEIKNAFIPYDSWIQSNPGEAVGTLGVEQLRSWTLGTGQNILTHAMNEDASVADELKNDHTVEKLILFQRYFLEFARTFVSLSELYDPQGPCMLQVGRLIMDGRRFDLNVHVDKIAEHKKLAKLSAICVLYLRIERYKKDGSILHKHIATAVTSGTMLNLYLHKTGLFITPDGKQWDARVVDIIINPVSISEALVLPFRRIGSIISTQIEKFSTGRFSKVEEGVSQGTEKATSSLLTQNQEKSASASERSGLMRDLVLGGSVAFAAVGSTFAFITSQLSEIDDGLFVIKVIIGIALLIILPISLVAIIKLRKRNIAALLEASGWAVNAPLQFSWRTGQLFTHTPKRDGGSWNIHSDRAEKLLKDIASSDKNNEKKFVIALILCITAFIMWWSFFH